MDLERLELAFAYHLADQVVGADGHVAPQEAAFLEERFGAGRLRAYGFVDEAGAFTEGFRAAVDEALAVLPSELPEARKVALMELLRQASLADQEGHESEANVLIVAARLLGLDPRRWADVGHTSAVRRG